jgi:UDP-N-acetyl-D-glucosamine dehydrogenase
MGGHCLPVDPFYLAWRAREFETPTEFVELAGEVNQRMPYFCAGRIGRALNEQGKAVKGARVSLVGVSYKPGVGDLRESPALKIIRMLRSQGAEVSYHDEHVPELADFDLRSEWPDEPDCVAIVTAHPGLDVERLVREAPLVVDFRGVTRGIEAPNLVRL